jgi:hypothetical protein
MKRVDLIREGMPSLEEWVVKDEISYFSRRQFYLYQVKNAIYIDCNEILRTVQPFGGGVRYVM